MNISMNMSKEQLLKIANENGVKVFKSWNKAKLVEAINSHLNTKKGATVSAKKNNTAPAKEKVAHGTRLDNKVTGFSIAGVNGVITNNTSSKDAPKDDSKNKNQAAAPNNNVKVSARKQKCLDILTAADKWIKEGKALYLADKNNTVVVRITGIEDGKLVGYTSRVKNVPVDRRPKYWITPGLIVDKAFRCVTGKEAAAIHNSLVKKANGYRYKVDIDANGDVALMDKKEKVIVNPVLSNAVARITSMSACVIGRKFNVGKDLVGRLNDRMMEVLKR